MTMSDIWRCFHIGYFHGPFEDLENYHFNETSMPTFNPDHSNEADQSYFLRDEIALMVLLPPKLRSNFDRSFGVGRVNTLGYTQRITAIRMQ